ncbi:MAG TPA: bifunctional DNA-binding transcriptional regulator/O6-methylguanine-DNA methyltransferase Ada [Crinalium sp.]|jgi:AraC family transcriptional regulator of adaptative response/methylated-DNA-[protein]-cysteine methyltransferase
MQNTAVTPFLTDTQRWAAVIQRDQQADGAFVYAVKSTGVYCRPDCSSRSPKLNNVLFFQSCKDAEAAGFRPCKRCKPNGISPHAEKVDLIARVCQLIATSETPLSLQELAKFAGLSSYHFHRVFKNIVGITPKEYMMMQRSNRVRDGLQQANSVTQTIYDAGFESSSRFYEHAENMLGMKPMRYKQGGSGMGIRVAIKQSCLGWVLVAATEKGICAIEFGESPNNLREQLHTRFPKAHLQEDDPQFTTWVTQVIQVIETPHQGLDLPLDIQGTAFQQRVWKALQDVIPGTTVSYADIADRIGNPKAVRAVARACASNTIAIAIPCHRVVRSNGDLSGYRWGIERKQALLEREASPEQN